MHYFLSILVFAIILKRNRKLVALLLLSHRCIVTINVLWLFLTVRLVGLHYVIVIVTDHTQFLFQIFELLYSACFMSDFIKFASKCAI